MENMASIDSPRTVLHADKEHAGVRFIILAILIVAFFIAFLILNNFISNMTGSLVAEYSLALSCIGGLVIGLAIAGITEFILKRTWPSGRGVTYDKEGIEARLPGGETVTLDWSKRTWATKWYFSLKGYPRGGREKRLSPRHYCLACQLQQDEARFIVYGYLLEWQAEEWLESGQFQEIKPGEYYEKSMFRKWFASPDRPDIPINVLTGKFGSYWMAEQRRWAEGIELTPGDLNIFLNEINRRVED